MKSLFKIAFLNALGTALYIVLVITLISVLEKVFTGKNTPLIAPIAMLMLFIFSALVTSGLMLGRPLAWYIDGRKKEAVMLLLCTGGMFFILLLLAFGAALLSRI